MKNAHLRFGSLQFTKVLRDTTIDITVRMDRMLMITLGKEAEAFRGSISIQGRKRPLRHLVVLSEELSGTRAGGNPSARRTILCNDDRAFVLYRIGVRFGLPVLARISHQPSLGMRGTREQSAISTLV